MMFGILGEVIALYGNVWILIISLLVTFAGVEYCKKRILERYLLLPFLIAGYLLITVYDYGLEENVYIQDCINNYKPVKVTGEIESIVTKQEKKQIVISSAVISDATSKDPTKTFRTKKVLVYIEGDINVKHGSTVTFSGNVSRFKEATNLGGFDLNLYYKSQNIIYPFYAKSYEITDESYSYIKELAHVISVKLKNSIYRVCNEKEASIFSAMLLGDKKNLDTEVYELYKKNGISHILAISGLHISLIGMSFYKMLRKTGFGFGVSAGLGSAFIIFYGLMTGMGISAQRAIIMFVINVIADVIGRGYDILSAMSLSALIMLAYQPYLILNNGFQLSYMAIVGITVVNNAIIEGFAIEDIQNSTIKKIVKNLISSLSVTLTTMPIIMWISYEIPLYSVLLNLVIIPLAPYVLLSGILGAVCGVINTTLGTFVTGIGIIVLRIYELLCGIFEKIPLSTIITGKPDMINVIVFYAIFVVVIYLWKLQYGKKGTILMALALACLTFRVYSPLEVTMLDVGQGDGILIRDYKGKTYMIDGGSTTSSELGKYTLVPFYKAYGISKLDYVIITHMDADHYNGIKEIIENETFDIETIVLGDVGKTDEKYVKFVELAKTKGINIVYMSKGMGIKNGDFSLMCLSPQKSQSSDNVNELSIALELKYKNVNMLFTGDIVDSGEEYLKSELVNRGISEIDVLKVAHHGSKYSTTDEFLEGLDIKQAIISCSEGNRYGHPHDELIERLNELEIDTKITKDTGMITLKSRGNDITCINFNTD